MTEATAQSAAGAAASPGTSPQSAPPAATSPSKSGSSPKSQANIDAAQFQTAEHWQELAQQEDDDDGASALGSDAASSTASLSSSIMQYRTILGRTFHAEQGNAEYWASNDQKQSESMDVYHHAILLILEEKLFLAPLGKDIQKVLDIGCGTGLWAIDFADDFPNAEVIGTDLSPIQPGWVPPNLTFEIEDCNLAWTFAPDSFDYIHLRYLFGSIVDWDDLFKNAFRCTKPGGWVESHEPTVSMESDDGTVTAGSAHAEWGKFFIEGAKKMGRSCTIVEDDVQRQSMESAGFVDIQVVDKKVPIGGWPKDSRNKEIGRYIHASLEQDIEGYVLYMASQLLGWTAEEVAVYCAQLRREVRSGKFHAFYRQRIVYGRKPE